MQNEKKALKFFRKNPGIHNTGEVLASGIYNRTLYRLRDRGTLVKAGYGLYRLADEEPVQHSVLPSSIPVPSGVITGTMPASNISRTGRVSTATGSPT